MKKMLAVLLVGSMAASVNAQSPKAQSPKIVKEPAAPTVVVEAKLLFKSPTPTAKELKTYIEGMVVYKYEVVKVTQGALTAKQILVAHWGIMKPIEQPITKTAIGAVLTLGLCPFEMLGDVKDLFRSDTTEDTSSPLFWQVGQKVQMPVDDTSKKVVNEGDRWNYGCTVGRVMPSYHLLREQLKLIVLGDCQGWFGTRSRHYFAEENAKTPVALSMHCERTCLSFYDTMVRNYAVKAPNLEWVVFAWQPRWLTQAKWLGFGTFNENFKNSPGFKYDQANAEKVFANRNPPPMTLDAVKANPQVGAFWAKHPWGDFHGMEMPAWVSPGEPKHSYNFPDQPPPQFNEQRWTQFEGIVKVLMDRKIRVLVYIIPFKGAKGSATDKLNTPVACYDYEVKKMKELEEKHNGKFFFYDFNNKGDNCMVPADNGLDHPAATGAVKISTEVSNYLMEMMKKHNIPTRPAGGAK